jgi:hypothetical protein
MTETAIHKRVIKDQDIRLIVKIIMNKENQIIPKGNILYQRRNMKNPSLVKNTPDHLHILGHLLTPKVRGQNVTGPKTIGKKGMMIGNKENLT